MDVPCCISSQSIATLLSFRGLGHGHGLRFNSSSRLVPSCRRRSSTDCYRVSNSLGDGFRILVTLAIFIAIQLAEDIPQDAPLRRLVVIMICVRLSYMSLYGRHVRWPA
jgi:hypothetical protein